MARVGRTAPDSARIVGTALGGSALGLIEVIATCARKRDADGIDAGLYQKTSDRVLDDWSRFFQIELTPDGVEQSLMIASNYALRGADSVTSPRPWS